MNERFPPIPPYRTKLILQICQLQVHCLETNRIRHLWLLLIGGCLHTLVGSLMLNHKMQLWVSGFGQYILQKERYCINRVMYKCSAPHQLLLLWVILAILVWVAILPHCG